MGIDLVEEWSAVLDAHTRDSHIDMDGERKEIDQPTFSNGCRFPGDPFGRPAEVYNCRCDLISWVRGFEPSQSVRERNYDTGNFKDWEDAARQKGVVFDRSGGIIDRGPLIQYDLQFFADGKTRAEKYEAGWSEESLSAAIRRYAPNADGLVNSEKGKITYSDGSTNKAVVYDYKGNYFRIEDETKGGKRRYTDINGEDVANKTTAQRTSGRSRDEYENMKHFKNKDF